MAVEQQETAAGLPYERTKWYAHYRVEKRHGDPGEIQTGESDGFAPLHTADQLAAFLAEKPYDVIEGEGNILVNNGATILWQGLRGDAITAFDSTVSRLGVGDSNTAAVTSQTDLQAATNKFRKVMDGGWPKVGVADGLSANQIQFQSTYTSGEANFAWLEWGAFNAASGSTSMLNRAVPGGGLGTKTTGSWTLTVTLSLSS